MKIILKQSVDSLGGEGEILEVKAGYARNYLIPKGWAKQATKVNIAATEKEIDARLKKEAKTRENLEALGKQLDKISLKFELKAGEEGKLFGSVTSQMIVLELFSLHSPKNAADQLSKAKVQYFSIA